MPTQPFSLQDAIAAWLTATQAGPSPVPAPEPTPDFRTSTTPADGLVDMAQPSQPKVDWRALALAAQGATSARAQVAAMAQQAQMAQATPWQNMGWRLAGGMGGVVIGGALGNVPGAIAGAATGAAAMSNEVVQPREVAQGTRAAVNPLVGAAEGLAAAPSGPASIAGKALLPQLPRVMAGNWGLGAAGDSVVQYAESGTVDPWRAVQAGNMSALIGGAIPVAARGVQALPGAARAIASSPAVERLIADETGAVGPRQPIPEDVAFAKAKALYLERGAGQSPVRMTQALRDSGYRDASHGVVARLISEAEGTPFTPRPEPTRVRRQAKATPRHNPFHTESDVKLHNVNGQWVWGTYDMATGRVIPEGQSAPAPGGRAGALARLFSDETGAVGPNIRIKPATARNIESAYRMSSPEVRQTLVDGLDPKFLDAEGDGIPVPKFGDLLAAAKAGDEGAVSALKVLRLDPTQTPAARTKAPTRVAMPQTRVEVAELEPNIRGVYDPLKRKVSLNKAAIAEMSPEERASLVRHELAHGAEEDLDAFNEADTALWSLWEKDPGHPLWDYMRANPSLVALPSGRFNTNAAREIVASLYANDYGRGTFLLHEGERPIPYEWEGENLAFPLEYTIPTELMGVLDKIEAKLGIWGKRSQRAQAKPPTRVAMPEAQAVSHPAVDADGNKDFILRLPGESQSDFSRRVDAEIAAARKVGQSAAKSTLRGGGGTPPPPQPPIASAAAPEPPRGPRQPYSPERPLDPQNLPGVIEARREPTPAWIAADKERSYRYNTEILGMDDAMARQNAEATVTPEAIARRRNIMPISEMQAKSNRVNAMDLLTKKPKVLTAEQQLALADTQRAASDQVRNINERIGGNLDTLRASVVAGDADAIARMQSVAGDLGVQGIDGIERARLEAATLDAELQLFGKATRSEWGRSGRAMQVEAKSRNLTDQQFLGKAYEMGAPPSAALEALDRLRGNPAAQRQYLEDLFKPSGQQMYKSYLANNMLSGVPTLGYNLGSNLVNYARKETARYQVAGIERWTGGTREIAVPPASLAAKSYVEGMRHAGRAFLSAMWEGRTDLDDTVAINVSEVFKGHWITTALAKSGVEQEMADKLGRLAVNKWKRILVGTDVAIQMMGIYPEHYRRTMAQALNEGLTGQALADAVRERVRGFDYHADASKAVRDYAKEITYAGDMGRIGKALQRLLNEVDATTVKLADDAHTLRTGEKKGDDFISGSKLKVVQVPFGFMVSPFVRIGTQLWRQANGILTDIPRAGVNLAAGRGNRVDNLQRLVESANAFMFAGTVAALYHQGMLDLTTRAPENDFERERFYGAEGKQPWAVGVAGRYIPMGLLGPLGDMLAPLAVSLKGLSKDDDEKTRMEKLGGAFAAIAKMRLDTTLVRSAMMLFDGLTDERKQGRMAGNFIAPFIPDGSFLRNVRDVNDSTLRDPKTITDEVKALLPGLSTTVDPRLNSWGEDIQKQNVLKRVIGSAPTGEDYVGQELLALKESLPDLGRMDEGVYPADLKVSASSFEKTLEQMVNTGVTNAADGVKVRFTEQEKQQYMRLVGTATQEALSAVIAPDNAEWTALTPQEKRAMVKSLKDLGREIGQELFLEVWLEDDPK